MDAKHASEDTEEVRRKNTIFLTSSYFIGVGSIAAGAAIGMHSAAPLFIIGGIGIIVFTIVKAIIYHG